MNAEQLEPDIQISRRIFVALVAALALCAFFFAWQAFHYRGIVNRLAEWQYARFGDYYPSLTFLALFVLFSIPAIVLILLWRRKRERRRGATARLEVPSEARIVAARTAEWTHRLQRYLGIMGAAAILAALGCLLVTFFLPGDDGPARQVDVATMGTRPVEEGATRLLGSIDTRMTARFDEKILLTSRRMFIAPMGTGPGNRAPVRFFVEIEPNFDRPAVRMQMSDGVLRRNALPGEIEQLYRNHGMNISRDTYLLYRTAYGPRWRFYALAVQCGLVGLVLSLASWLERRRARRLAEWTAQLDA